MGTRGLTRAYASLISKNPEFKDIIKEIILAAPDIDAEIFERDIAPMIASEKNNITIYASSEDLALKSSKKFHGLKQRLGDSTDGIFVYPGIEKIDASKVNTSFLGHSTYAENKSLLSDIFYILNFSIRADKRSDLIRSYKNDKPYWEFMRWSK